MRTMIAAVMLLTASAAFAHGDGHGPGGCMGHGYGMQSGPGPMCEGAAPGAALHEKMRAEMFELRRLQSQGAAPEAYAEQLKRVDEARREMSAVRGEGPHCLEAMAARGAAK